MIARRYKQRTRPPSVFRDTQGHLLCLLEEKLNRIDPLVNDPIPLPHIVIPSDLVDYPIELLSFPVSLQDVQGKAISSQCGTTQRNAECQNVLVILSSSAR